MADAAFARSFALETWTMYGVGVVLVALRFTARLRRFSLAGLKLDDWLMANATVWYTLLCVAFNNVAAGGGSNLMSDDDIAALTPESYADRVAGSKWVFVSEHSMVMCIWSCKVCMLVLYATITDGLKQRRWVNWLAIWIGISFVGTELGLWLSCRPVQQYWAVPANNPQCSTYQHYEIIMACFNIPGDIVMLCIGIPILASIRLPIQQKAILLLIFGMGGFIIVASILTKIYCLVPELISYVYMNWYFREASVAMYVTNLPAIWPLLRDLFPALKTWGTSKTNKSTPTLDKRYAFGNSRGARVSSKPAAHELSSFSTTPLRRDAAAESQEHIRHGSDAGSSASATTKSLEANVLEIHRDVTVTVESEGRDTLQRGSDARYGWDRGNKAAATRTVVETSNV